MNASYDPQLTAEDVRKYLTELGRRLEERGLRGEILMAGGALLIARFGLERKSEDIDAIFLREADAIRAVAAEMAVELDLAADWINDRVWDYLPATAPREEFMVLPGLTVWSVTPEYLFYMKCTGADFDAPDLLFLSEKLGGVSFLGALDIYVKYAGGTPPRDIQLWLEELLP